MTALFLFVLGAAIRGRKYPVVSGREALIGASGTATSDLTPNGLVHVKGEVWTARAQGNPFNRVMPCRWLGLRPVLVGREKTTERGKEALKYTIFKEV